MYIICVGFSAFTMGPWERHSLPISSMGASLALLVLRPLPPAISVLQWQIYTLL